MDGGFLAGAIAIQRDAGENVEAGDVELHEAAEGVAIEGGVGVELFFPEEMAAGGQAMGSAPGA